MLLPNRGSSTQFRFIVPLLSKEYSKPRKIKYINHAYFPLILIEMPDLHGCFSL